MFSIRIAYVTTCPHIKNIEISDVKEITEFLFCTFNTHMDIV